VLENGDGVIADGSNSANDVNDAEEKTEAPENETPEADENTAFDPATITPEKLYQNIVKELSNVDNVTITAEQDIAMNMTVNGQSVPVQTMKQGVTQKYDKGNFSMVTTNNLAATLNCQYVDGVVYNVQITDGAKIKYAATEKELAALAGIDVNAAKIMNIPADWFENCELKADEDGNGYYIEFVLNGEEYKQLFSNFALLDSVKEVSNVTHKVYVTAEGKIDSIVSTATMVVAVEGTEVVADMVSVSTYGDIGSTVVEAPADADSYVTVDISQLK
jgi:hypothetical protein